MKLTVIFSFFLVFITFQLSAQETEQPIVLANPSFEGLPLLSKTPDRWFDCGFPGESEADVHPVPNSDFKVDKIAYHGDTYVGMVVRENDTWEAIGQRLSAPLIGGECYEFSIHLSRSPLYQSLGRTAQNQDKDINYATPSVLRIWGGNGYCKKAELLAETSEIVNTRWLEYNFRFEPKENLSYITLEAFYKTPNLFPYSGNILLDNAQPIIPVPCDDEIDEPIAIAEPIQPPSQPKPKPKTEPIPEAVPPTTPTRPTQEQATIAGNKKETLKLGQVILLKDLKFDADSTVIPPRSFEAMNELYDFLSENKDLQIEIGGHTNGQPPHEYCDKISLARAESVAEFLMARGIKKERLKWKGYGKRNPIMSNKTAYGRKQNQRVEIKILGFKGEDG